MQLTTFAGVLALSGAAFALPQPLEARQAANSTAPPAAPDAELIANLRTAATEVERVKLLSPGQLRYDFNNPPASAITMGKGGHTVKADSGTFPASIRTGVSMTVGFIGPCGFNTPHTHPRSSEFNIIVQGSLGTNFIAENGDVLHTDVLTQYQATIFPKGALHTEFNPSCEPAVFVAGFGNEDPGVLQAAQNLFNLEDDVTSAVLNLPAAETINGANLAQFRAQLPHNVALGIEQCLVTCGIQQDRSGP